MEGERGKRKAKGMTNQIAALRLEINVIDEKIVDEERRKNTANINLERQLGKGQEMR